jgi:hypothetical protein
MKIVPSVLLGLFLVGSAATAGRSTDCFRYISPRPGAQFVSKETTIILRPEIQPASGVGAFTSVEVRGSTSGSHAGEWITTEHDHTFIFRPREAFAPGETVYVTVPLIDGNQQTFSFDFTIRPQAADLERGPIEPCQAGCCDAGPLESTRESQTLTAVSTGLTLPESFPALTVTINDNPAPGYVVVGPKLDTHSPPYYAVMLENTGLPVFFRELPRPAADFKKHSSVGLYSYLQGGAVGEFVVVNENFEFVDAFHEENGYSILDGHDFQIASNGNVLIAIQDWQHIDMSAIVPGGHPNATVVGFVMQEQDAAHQVAFEWRSWDHFEITDAVGIDLTAPFIDYVHFNAFEYDTDGNILISCREMCEITKVDRQTGDIIWRMGGSQNEFTLVGDTQWFERQHSIRRTPTGTITVFDNGALNPPWESRAVEYEVDEVERIATMVWEFRHDPPLFSGFGSNVQRLPNGNTMINWTPRGLVTEVRSDGTKAFEMVFDEHQTYRAFRFEWDGVAARPELWYEATSTEVTLHFAKFGDPDVAQFYIYRGASPEPTTRVGSTTDNWYVLPVEYPETLYARVTAVDSTGMNESPYSNEQEIIVPAPVEAPVVESLEPRLVLCQNHPNPFGPFTNISFALPEQDLVDLSVYDVRGRLVRRLIHDVMAQGVKEVLWDGTDSRGRRAGSGLYFYRLEAGGQEVNKKMVRLR